MNLLDRHIFKHVLFTCAASVGLFAFVLIMVNAFKDLIGPLLAGQLGWDLAGELVLMLIPVVAPFALPAGILTGVLLTLGRLSSDGEITAMRAAGLGLARIARPILILGVAGAAFALYANFYAMPRSRISFEKQLADALRANPIGLIAPKTFVRTFKGFVIYLGEKQGNIVRDFWYWRLDDMGRTTQFVRVGSGHFTYDEAAHELILSPVNVQVESRSAKAPEDFSESPMLTSFEKSDPVHLPLGSLFGRNQRQQKLREMTYDELATEAARVAALPVATGGQKEHDRAVMKVLLARQEKFTLGVAVLSFAVMAVPLGIRVSRRETSANLGVAVALALGYYMLTVMVGWLDRHPEYRPDLLLWIPNVVFLALGVWLFRRIEK